MSSSFNNSLNSRSEESDERRGGHGNQLVTLKAISISSFVFTYSVFSVISVHGNWGSWNMWSFCSVKCGPGKRERMRKCDNPPPKFGGENCPGSDRQTMPCSLSDCPVDGKWGLWSPWTACSATCGAAKRSRTRGCDHPPPAHAGKTCEGPERQEEYCKLQPCMGGSLFELSLS